MPADKRRDFDWAKVNPFSAIMRMRKIPAVGPLVLVLFLFSIAQNVYPSVWSYFTQLRFGFSPGMVGLSLAIFGLCMTLVQGGLIRIVIPKFGEMKTAQVGLLFNASVLVLVAFITSQFWLFAFMPLMAFGIIVSPALQGLMSQAIEDDRQGELQGVLASVQGMAMIVSPLAMTGLFRAFTAEWAPVYAPGAPFIAAGFLALAAFLLLRRHATK